MNITVYPGAVDGALRSIPSKSQAHRLLICAALADRPTRLLLRGSSQDITATCRCLTALGAVIQPEKDGLLVTPIDRSALPERCRLDCGESGSTLRFLLPVTATLGVTGEFLMGGRLPQRPLAPLDQELTAHGCRLDRPAPDILRCQGQLKPGDYTLPGNVSSQYISGLLFALPLLAGASTLTVTEPVESAGYIDMTLDALSSFGVRPEREVQTYRIAPGACVSPGTLAVEGDWSNAAFWLCAGAMPGCQARISGLRPDSLQADRAVADLLAQMGARLTVGRDIAVRSGRLAPLRVDASSIPDLVPALAAAASVASGTTILENAARLRLKESDRLRAVAQTLNALGADVDELPDGLAIHGVKQLSGGTVDACGDHRIAMMAAIASCVCRRSVTITGAEAVNKSYPGFWRDLALMGKSVREAAL